jgi:tetratricopeptide (TPR) repeat protein
VASILEEQTISALLAGDPGRAEELATAHLEQAVAAGEANPELMFAGAVMTATWMRGALADLLPRIEETAAGYPGYAVFHAVRAQALAQAGRVDEVRGLLAEVAAGGFSLPEDGLWITTMMGYADAVTTAGLAEFAGHLHGALEPYAPYCSIMQGTLAGPVAHQLGALAALLGRTDEAEARFGEALAFAERFDAAFFAARTRVELGALLLGRGGPGDADRGRELVESALDEARARGYGGIERRARAVLHASTARPARARRRGGGTPEGAAAP